MNRSLRRLALGLLIVAGLVIIASPADRAAMAPQAPAQELQITVDEVVASGFTHPVQVTHAGDGSGRLFVVEQPGTIRVVASDGTVLPEPFLDITALTQDVGERGLLGLAFHPDAATNGFFYVDYTRAADGTTIIERYTVSGTDPNLADPTTATTILTVTQPFANHNGGQILFGPDGYLYIGLGDGGSGGDPQGNAQDPTTLLGSILRLDVDGGAPYAIPPDNPFVGTDGRDEVWAYGLRNPWRFSFDRGSGTPTTADLYIGDVGQAAWEEISFQAAETPGGVNFGWNCLEGTHEFEMDAACEAAALTDPIAEYDHDLGSSVTGGFVYRGTDHPALVGHYFYADFGSGRIWSLTKTDAAFTAPVEHLETALNISSFGEDEAGELYVVDWGGGTIRRLADAGSFVPTHTLWLPVITNAAGD